MVRTKKLFTLGNQLTYTATKIKHLVIPLRKVILVQPGWLLVKQACCPVTVFNKETNTDTL